MTLPPQQLGVCPLSPYRQSPAGWKQPPGWLGRNGCRCYSTVLQRGGVEHGGAVPTWARRLGERRGHRPVVSSGEPQVSGFSPFLLHVYLTRGRVAVSGVCVARGVMTGGCMGRGSWPPSTGERSPGEEGSIPMSECCRSAGPEVARTVWANLGSTHGSPGQGLSPRGTA